MTTTTTRSNGKSTANAWTRADAISTVRATGAGIPGRHRELLVLNRESAGWRIAQYMFQARPEQEA